jgi:hypothetical protein
MELLRELGYVSEADAAMALGVQVSTLRNWRLKGHGPKFAKPSGETIVYSIETLRDWIEANTVDPREAFAPTLADAAPARGRGRPRKQLPVSDLA